MTEDGPLAPSSLSIFLVGGSFILAAMLHPQEFWCLPHGIIYYITIPAMYLLLVIYSIFNLVRLDSHTVARAGGRRDKCLLKVPMTT